MNRQDEFGRKARMVGTDTLRSLRCQRTKASNLVRSTIDQMLKEEAPYKRPDGLPSWWPFWSACLVSNVRDAVRKARELQQVESCLGARHGDVSDWPDNWPPVEAWKTCDWGECDKPATKARYDARGHGWLPVCDDCAKKPMD
jgi:hypothetical protein